MAILVHISSEKNKKSILQSGIKTGYGNIVFFMPHSEQFLIAHQWARELKRSGIKNCIAVDFKIKNNEIIWFGKYNENHEKMPLNIAIDKFMKSESKYGYEFFIERKIEPKEILKIRHIKKPMGWRYMPNAHGKKPCPCPMCIQDGGYKTNRLKEKNENKISRYEAKEILLTSSDIDKLWEAVCRLQGKWKKESPEFLKRLFVFNDEYLLYDLVILISEYRHPLTKKYMEKFSHSSDNDISEFAKAYLEIHE
ncbi:MAG: hypothetical protein OQL19_15090 [Gammaproteobacteria bacterium]|nr:hypothetical protein [Gammaproteobacteria bacterium]